MSLLQISEPGQTQQPHQRRCVIGIDLGTTNSLVASKVQGQVQVLRDLDGRALLPSVLALGSEGVELLGYAAVQADEQYVAKIRSVKRILGYSLDEIAEQKMIFSQPIKAGEFIPVIATRFGDINPIEVSARILSALRQRAEQTLAASVHGAVITVPAYFDESRRKATKDAATIAGLSVLRLINEPTAAALAYGLDTQATGNVLVYDLGGGTFDVSILALQDHVFEVKSTCGDILLGGDDMDAAVVAWVCEQAPDATKNLSVEQLQQWAKTSKEALTEQLQTEISLPKQTLILARSQLESLCEPLFARTLQSVEQALRDAKLDKQDIAHIVLVGGVTRMPMIQQRLSNFFNQPVLNTVNPDEVVAIGAAMAAENLAGEAVGEQLLIDVTPLSLGIETAGDLVEVIIARNSAIPITRAQEFTTFKDGQTAMKIHVLQGERDNVHECRSLAQFSLKGIPPMAAGLARVEVVFHVDANGLLTVSAEEASTQTQAKIEVTPSYGLSEEAIMTLLQSASQHAEIDIFYRKLHEQIVDAERLLDAIDKALREDSALLNDIESVAIEQARQALVALLHMDTTAMQASETIDAHTHRLANASQRLENAADSFIEKRMNQAINQVMQGHNVDEFNA